MRTVGDCTLKEIVELCKENGCNTNEPYCDICTRAFYRVRTEELNKKIFILTAPEKEILRNIVKIIEDIKYISRDNFSTANISLWNGKPCFNDDHFVSNGNKAHWVSVLDNVMLPSIEPGALYAIEDIIN